MREVRDAVRDGYAAQARILGARSGLGDACCGDGGESCGPVTYEPADLAGLGVDRAASLGCGNPLLLAELRPGEVVLDLGSGGGLDVLLAARRVAPGGWAYGVDMTAEMLELANANRARAGIENASFVPGAIEAVPLPDASVDVVISNCVINLAEDKAAVLREAFRVLRPGGRLAVADMVELRPLPPRVRRSVQAWVGCVAGALPASDYPRLLAAAGFQDVAIEVASVQDVPGARGAIGSAYVRARRPADDRRSGGATAQ